MTDFLLKSTISMGILLTIYHLLLEREKMHRFNRFYLLGALVFSLVLPFITIPVYAEAVQEPAAAPLVFTPVAAPIQVAQPRINYWPYIGWVIYCIITLVLTVRFTRNILHFVRLKKNNPTVNDKGATIVLLDDEVLPHTFLKTIYLNKNDYESRLIEPELFTHELAHVKQYHTLDILFAEALKTLFWFNPLLYLYKRAIRLNHEFLADENTISNHLNIPSYQQLLLQKAVPATLYPLASSINYSITKKRFTMMTKTTSKMKALVLKTALIPVVASMLALLCTKTIAQEIKGSMPDPSKISRIEVNTVTKTEMDSLKKADPARFGKSAGGYKKIEYTYTDDNGKEAVKVQYEKDHPKQEMVMLPEKPEIDSDNLSRIEAFQLTPAQIDSVRVARPEWFSKDPNVRLKATIFRFTDKNGVVTEKIGYQELSPEEKAKVGDIPISGAGSIELWEVPEATEPKKTYNLKNAMAHLQEEKVYPFAELKRQPEFPGGINAFHKRVMSSFRVPEVDQDMTARIYVSFIIEKDGSMSNIKAERDPGYGMGDEAVRVIKSITTKWKPGIKKRKPVRTSYTLPIVINVKDMKE